MDKENINGEHDAPRDKLQSYSTLNSLYHETQQEIELLNRQILVKDNIISELKVRLGRYESIYLSAGNNEPVVIGPSKCLVESLCKEVWNPQQRLKDMEQKSSGQAEVNIRAGLLSVKSKVRVEMIVKEGNTVTQDGRAQTFQAPLHFWD